MLSTLWKCALYANLVMLLHTMVVNVVSGLLLMSILGFPVFSGDVMQNTISTRPSKSLRDVVRF